VNNLDAFEQLDPEALRLRQQQLWQKQGAYVFANSKFYHELWQAEAPPTDLDELRHLPLSSKAQLRLSQEANAPFGDYLAASRSQVN